MKKERRRTKEREVDGEVDVLSVCPASTCTHGGGLFVGMGLLCFYFCAIMLLSIMLSSRFWSAIMLPIMLA